MAYPANFLFLCRFGCGKTIFRNEAGDYMEQESGKRHVCKPSDVSQIPPKFAAYSGPQPCFFCHAGGEGKVRAVIYFKESLREPAMTKMVVCFTCTEKVFNTMADVGK